jgi:hypothetical protein
MNNGGSGGADHPNGIKPLIPPDADRSYIVRRSIDAMDNTRTDDLIRRNHELLAAAAQAWSAFMETVARIDQGVDVSCALARHLGDRTRARGAAATSITVARY